jgi:hypothetical protein
MTVNKKLTVAMLFPAVVAFAGENLDATNLAKVAKEREEWTKQHFAKQGSPVPDGGVTVIPEQQMSEYHTFKAQRAQERADIKKYGYIKQFLPQTQSLLNLKEISKNQFIIKSVNPANEGLRHNVNEIEMAYDFKGVPAHTVTAMLGVAPSVTYIKGQGWAGAMQFFYKTGIGNCSYRENNLKFSHGAAIIPEEDATKDVNGKVTVANVTGEKNAGFLYSIDWYDNSYFRELKCANGKYDPTIMSSTLELARLIDNNG